MAENPFFNRVDERNGSVIMDISDTTATANDVLAGKKFYSASGAPATGTLVPGTITEVQANGTSIATSGIANIPAASTSGYGVTKLNNTTSSTSTSEAATAAVAKQLSDKIGNVESTDLQSQVDLLNSNLEKTIASIGVVTTSTNLASIANKYASNGTKIVQFVVAGNRASDMPQAVKAYGSGIINLAGYYQSIIYCADTGVYCARKTADGTTWTWVFMEGTNIS